MALALITVMIGRLKPLQSSRYPPEAEARVEAGAEAGAEAQFQTKKEKRIVEI
jgi:hypothetical protein